MRAVACKIVVLPLQSCCSGAQQRGNEASKEWLSTCPDVHDVFALLYVDANFTHGLGLGSMLPRFRASSCDVLFTRYNS
jgi:hypothetical protein